VTVIIGNRTLAARARDLASRAPRGSLERKAAGCLSVVLGETRTVAAARQVLDTIEAADIRTRAAEMLGELLSSGES
jgi:hypothetical protein